MNNLSFFYPHECITSELTSYWGHLRISQRKDETCNKYFSFHSCRHVQEKDGKWSAPTIQSTIWDMPHYHQIHTLIAKAAMQGASVWQGHADIRRPSWVHARTALNSAYIWSQPAQLWCYGSKRLLKLLCSLLHSLPVLHAARTMPIYYAFNTTSVKTDNNYNSSLNSSQQN